MNVALRPCLAALAVVSLAIAMTLDWGFFTLPAFAAALAALALALLACTLPDWGWRISLVPERLPVGTWLIASLALALSAYGIPRAEVLSQEFRPEMVTPVVAVLPWAAFIGFLMTNSLVLLLFFPGKSWRYLFPVGVMALFLAGAILRGAAVVAVPDPVIDVFAALRGAPDHLLHGRNPYTSAYEHPYAKPPEEYDRYPFYPPLPILFGLPFHAVGLDVRFANVVCDLLAAWVLLEMGRGRGGALAGALAAAAYLNFPRAPFMMEQDWYEPMLAATLGSGLLLAERGRWLGYFLLGLGLTGKQYGVVLLFPLLRALWRRRLALALGIAGAACLVILPFLLWDPWAFIEVIFWVWRKRPPRDDGLTIWVGARVLFDWRPSGWVLRGIAALLIGWVAWRTPARGIAAAFWMGTALLVFCLFNSQAFFNYFYLCEYLFLVGILGMATDPERNQA